MGDKRGNLHRALLAAVLPGLLGAAFAPAQASDTWKVQNRLQGKIEDGKPEKSEDVSGMACAPGALPRLCLVVDDETQGAQVVILTQGTLIAGDFIQLIHDLYQGKALELDAESVGYADGFFYVAGSQGRARHDTDAGKEAKNAAKAEATQRLFRIGIAADAVDFATGVLKQAPAVTESTVLARVLKADRTLGRYFDQPLDENGLAMEGLAVRGDALYAGLRGPVLDDDGRAVIAKVPLAVLFEGKAGAAQLFHLDLGKDSLGVPRGIRDLTASGDGFLLIAGPENDPPKKHKIEAGDYSVYAWDEGAALKRADLASYGKKSKPEALVPLAADGNTLHALLMFDGPKEGMPTPVDIPLQ